jgi:effector-binding domain-containing protein
VNSSQFLLAEKDGGTEITWTMEGSLPFLFFWMKGMMTAFVGMDYLRGLGMLKDYVESGEVPCKLDFLGIKSWPGCRYIGVRCICAMSELGPQMEMNFGRLTAFIGERDLETSGAPLSVYHKWSITKGLAEFTSGFPVAEVPADLPADLVSGEIPAGSCYAVKHTGAYRHLGNAWAAGEMRARAKPKIFARNRKIDPFEVYENDPEEVPEREVVTVVHFPVK